MHLGSTEATGLEAGKAARGDRLPCPAPCCPPRVLPCDPHAVVGVASYLSAGRVANELKDGRARVGLVSLSLVFRASLVPLRLGVSHCVGGGTIMRPRN